MEATEHFGSESLIHPIYTWVLVSIAPILLVCASGVYGMSIFYIPLTLAMYLCSVRFVFDRRGLFDVILFTVVCGSLSYAGYKSLGPLVSFVLVGLTVGYVFLLCSQKTMHEFFFLSGHVLVIVWTASLLFTIPPHMLWHPKDAKEVSYNETPQWLISPFSYSGKLEYAPPLTGKVTLKDKTEEGNEVVLNTLQVTYSVAPQMLNTTQKWVKLRELEGKGVSVPAPTQEKSRKELILELLKETYPFIHFKIKEGE